MFRVREHIKSVYMLHSNATVYMCGRTCGSLQANRKQEVNGLIQFVFIVFHFNEFAEHFNSTCGDHCDMTTTDLWLWPSILVA